MNSSLSRRDQAVSEIAYSSLHDASQLAQAEKIADHYTRLAITACHLKLLIEQQNKHDSLSTIAAIGHYTQEIQKAHMQDFGIPLEWDQSPRDEDKMSIEELITEGIRVINRIVEMPEQNTAEIIT